MMESHRHIEVSLPSRWTRSLIRRLEVTCLRLEKFHKKMGCSLQSCKVKIIAKSKSCIAKIQINQKARKRGHKAIYFIEMKKRLCGLLTMVFYHQQCDFKELAEKIEKETAMQPKVMKYERFH